MWIQGSGVRVPSFTLFILCDFVCAVIKKPSSDKVERIDGVGPVIFIKASFVFQTQPLEAVVISLVLGLPYTLRLSPQTQRIRREREHVYYYHSRAVLLLSLGLATLL